MKNSTESLAAPMHSTNQASQHTPALWPNLADILREHAKTSAGPFYDEVKTEKAIAYARNAIDSHQDLIAALENLLRSHESLCDAVFERRLPRDELVDPRQGFRIPEARAAIARATQS